MSKSVMSAHAGGETLECYALGRLQGARLARVEEHLLVCEECRARLTEIDDFVRTLRATAESLTNALTSSHHTSDGTVRLTATQKAQGWVARFEGAELEGEATFPSLREAHRFLQDSFQQMFPEHRCGKRCRQPSEGLPCRPRGRQGSTQREDRRS